METAIRRREQEVWHACDEIYALEGGIQKLTGDAIRERLIHLGKSRGSPNEIYKYRKSWLKSRGLENPKLDDSGNVMADPITRAVKLVHEQLRLEAKEQLAAQQEGFLEEIRVKDEEIAKLKAAMDAMLIEYQQAARLIDEGTHEKNLLQQRLQDEIEKRKAVETDLSSTKWQAEKEKSSHDLILSEMKLTWQKEHDRLVALLETTKNDHVNEVKALYEERRNEGFLYSERLSELKTILYNHEIQAKRHEEKVLETKKAMHNLSLELQEKDRKLEGITREHHQLSLSLKQCRDDVEKLIGENRDYKNEIKAHHHAVKKAHITIARLRTVVALTPSRRA